MIVAHCLFVVAMVLMVLAIFCAFGGLGAMHEVFSPFQQGGGCGFVLLALILWLTAAVLGVGFLYTFEMALDRQHDVIWDKVGSRPLFH